MKIIDLKTIGVLVALLLCAATTAVMVAAHAQDNQKAGANRSGGKDKGTSAAKSSNDLDDGFSPKAKSNEKTSGQPGVGNKSKAVPEEIRDPLAESTPKIDSVRPARPRLAARRPRQVPRRFCWRAEKAGVMRICLVTPRAQMSAGDTAQAGRSRAQHLQQFSYRPDD
jgi:hypothetical protein